MAGKTTRELILDILTVCALIGSLATTAVAIVGRTASPKPSNVASKPVPVKQWKSLIDTQHMLGPTNASTIAIEFGDFQCPACRSFRAEVNRLRAEFPNDFAVAFHYAPLPYHARAYPAARAAECAAVQGKFSKYHDALFDNFSIIDTVSFSALAKRTGIGDLSVFEKCVSRTEPDRRIDADRSLAFDTLRIRGTPAFIVEGMLYDPMPTHAEMERIIKANSHRATDRGHVRADPSAQ